ncbi:hypothetical protein QJS66_05850 [Kocuria rhizophila]|nr:hypothetical protein QJS66_05850 [Kocuria rhizophila]
MRNETDVLGIDHEARATITLNRQADLGGARGRRRRYCASCCVDEFERVVVGIAGSDVGRASSPRPAREVEVPGIWAKALTAAARRYSRSWACRTWSTPRATRAPWGQRTWCSTGTWTSRRSTTATRWSAAPRRNPSSSAHGPAEREAAAGGLGRGRAPPGWAVGAHRGGTRLYDDDQILVTGPTRKVEHFSNLTDRPHSPDVRTVRPRRRLPHRSLGIAAGLPGPGVAGRRVSQ